MTSYQTGMGRIMTLSILCILSSWSWYFNLSVEAYSTGAPVATNPQICTTMTPNHQVEATPGPSSYFISVGTVQYTPGQPLTITVTKSTTDPTAQGFKGIFMQMRRKGTNQITGTWTVSDETNFQTVSCGGVSNNAVTHRNNAQKNFLNTFTWLAPAGESADVNVVATYVEERTTFWVRETGPTIPSTASGPCNPNPCQSGGTCTQLGNAFSCTCLPPYSGTTCQTVTALPCNSSPCLNGGTCFNNQQSSFTCICPPGYMESRCEQLVLPCNSNPCVNGGTCVNVNQQSSFTCSCPTGYSGQRCEQLLVMPCNSNPCANGGTCVNVFQQSAFICSCPNGYSGLRCEQAPSPCNPNPCLQQGTCISLGNDFVCFCSSPFGGKTCSDVVLPCDSNPCQNGGTCQDIDMETEFVCACQTGFSGTFCTIADPCYPNPCMQHGTCIANGNDFTCSCPPSYDGKTCNNLVSPCDPDPCSNGGTCFDLNLKTDFFCTCASGFKGVTCEEKEDLVPMVPTTQSINGSTPRGKGRKLFYNSSLIIMAVVVAITFL